MVVSSGKRRSPWAQEAHINWELNERISLSSIGSIRNESTSRSRGESLSIRAPKPVHPTGVDRATGRVAKLAEASALGPGTPVQRRWNAANEHLDRTNVALDKRLSLIEELNRKILVNYDRMQMEKRKSRWKVKGSPAEEREQTRPPAEKRRVLGEKTNLGRRAAGERSLPEGPEVEAKARSIGREVVGSDSSSVSSARASRASDRSRRSFSSSPKTSKPRPFWAEESAGSLEDASAQESSVLRELNEAIDRFEEENCEGGLQANDSKISGCHDSSWDSGVGGELPGGAAAAKSPGLARGCGWLRVHTGVESSLVYLTMETTAADVCRDMLLSDNLALYLQYGGEAGRRLDQREKPLELQEELLLGLGYREATRRARLGLDAELQHLVAFHMGPAAPLEELRGYSRCGYGLVLKGLVFPQWKKRALAVLGSRLFLYPACAESQPEWMELADGGSVSCVPSRLGKLVLRVTGRPRITQRQRAEEQRARELRHLYLGFQHSWDRDLWRRWIKQACQTAATSHAQPSKLDMSDTGVSRIPETVRAFAGVRELFLAHNQLSPADGNFKLLLSLPEVQELHLENNRLDEVPIELLSLGNLTFLDLSDNEIHRIPPDISSLSSLKELIVDRNDIKELPDEIRQLHQLRHISLVGNLIEILPAFLLEMRALTLTDVLSGRTGEPDAKTTADEKNNLHSSLHKVNLRNNQLKGNIILGNYGNLTHLDLSENNIEKLDLSALQVLRSVRCARNILTELTLCGHSLTSLIAGNNKLRKLTIAPVPVNLEHLDVSYNNLENLPEWTPELPVLRALFASHNSLSTLPDRLLSQPTASRLEVLHLPHNRIEALPPPRAQLSLVHLTLQDNALTALPLNFFASTLKMKVLNLSNNRLTELPWNRPEASAAAPGHRSGRQEASATRSRTSLEKLYLTGNSLTNTAFDVLGKFRALRVLHLAYNALDTLPESCIASWKELEELVLSGNKLQYIPDNVADLPHLRVLRIHSNRLLSCPAFNKTSYLKVLDLAHNHLDRLNVDNLLSAQLQFLDISCNSRLCVDLRQFQSYNSARRPLSLVDVSGQNRSAPGLGGTSTSLASRPSHRKDAEYNHLPWRLGFSETAGTRERLLISQVRMPTFCNTEGLFGLFDGGSNQEAPASLQEMIPRILLEERTAKETRSEYLRYTLLTAQRELRNKGQKYGVDAALVHITALLESTEEKPRYLLTAASCGEARAVLCRASGPLQLAKGLDTQYLPRLQAALAQSSRAQKSGVANLLPIALPEPTSEEVILEEDDEFVIIGSRRLWEVLSIQEAVREARAEANPVLAAKRLQDLGQAYGAEDNLSVLVVRLSTGSAEPLGRLLMRELRQAVRTKELRSPAPEAFGCTCPCCTPRVAGHETPAACCCHAGPLGISDSAASSVNGFYLNGVVRNVMSTRSSAKSSRSSQRQLREDRSSPSGQSDQTSEAGLFEPRSRRRASDRFCSGSANACKLRQQQQQQQQQQHALAERTPPPSDEQLRCWEYMLEQNTQLLFDKELDTLTSAPRSSVLRRGRGQSRSTPQLGPSTSVPFLSRRFGSARSFDNGSQLQGPRALLQPAPVLRSGFGGSGRRLLNGGPNAAYFGSLQRLMPYNLEYDFAVIQERAALDSLEQDASRMQQYWGVATTEL